MGTRSNACSELTRFWLQARHRCVVDESVPVKVPFGNSDIDLVAVRANLQPFQLPDGTSVGPRLIVETKDEHDFDTSGSTFGGYLRKDIGLMDAQPYIPEGDRRRSSACFGSSIIAQPQPCSGRPISTVCLWFTL